MGATATTATTVRLDRPDSAEHRDRRADKGRRGLLVSKVHDIPLTPRPHLDFGATSSSAPQVRPSLCLTYLLMPR